MITVSELSTLLDLSKERTKQLVNEAVKDSSLDIETGTVWRIGPQAVRKFLADRGKRFPDHKVVTFAALKGGIGKTTISTNVAVRAASLGAKVLLLDLDPEACATNGLVKDSTDLSKQKVFYDILSDKASDIKSAILPTKYDGLDLIPSSLRNHRLEKIVGNMNPKRIIKDRLKGLDYNLIILELPPSFTTLTGSAYLAADLIVLPCIPNIYSFESVGLTIESVNALASEFECSKRNYVVLMNNYNPNKLSSQDILKELLDTYKSMVFPTYIREATDIVNATNAGLTVFDAPCSKSIREGFNELTMAVIGLISENL